MSDDPTYLKQRPDGLWEETRFQFKPGDRVGIIGGPYEGQEAVIDTLIGMVQEDNRWIADVGYNAKLEDGRYITIRWDLVEEISK